MYAGSRPVQSVWLNGNKVWERNSSVDVHETAAYANVVPCSEQSEATQEAIAYKKGMVLEAGKTYKQYGKSYLCTRGSENPVSGNLKDLTIYVEPIK